MIIFDFPTAPAVGTVLKLDEQEYELAAAEPYRRKDGLLSSLLRWCTSCPTCGTPFEVLSGPRITSLPRRCLDHRQGTKPVKGKRGRKVVVTVVPA